MEPRTSHNRARRAIFEPLEGRTLLTGTLLHDLGPQSQVWGVLVEFNGDRYFTVLHNEQPSDGGPQYADLWKSDGTAAGTQRITHQLHIDWITGLQVYNDQLLFFTHDPSTGVRLWTSDGTAAGTQVLEQIGSGPRRGPDGSHAEFTPLNGKLLFLADDGVHGHELWATDGTAAGTFMLKDTISGFFDSGIFDLQTFGGHAYFTTSGNFDRAPWVTDGTTDGTVQISGVAAGDDPFIREFFEFAGQVMYTGFDGIYATDPAGSAVRVTPYAEQPNFAVHGDTLLFTGWDRPLPPEDPDRLPEDPPTNFIRFRPLWKMTAAGVVSTVLSGLPLSALGEGIWFGDAFYFSAWDAAHGQELWKFDAAGVRMLKDTNPGPGDARLGEFKVINGVLYFLTGWGSGSTGQLWRTNGTAAGTVPVTAFKSPAPGAGYFISYAPFGDGLLMAYIGNGHPIAQLWKSAGAAGTNVLLKQFDGAGLTLSEIDFAGRRYFHAYQPALGWELWSTDATASGTRRETDIFPGPSITVAHALTVHNDRLLFTANGDGLLDPAQLWSLDGLPPSGNEPYIDLAGNTLAAARAIALGGAHEFGDAVGPTDNDDFFKFTHDRNVSVTFSLTGLTANADLELIHDRDLDGVIDVGEVVARSANAGLAADSFSVSLRAGTYQLRVRSASAATTTFALKHSSIVTAPLGVPGVGPADALPLGRLRGNRFVYEATGRGSRQHIRFVLRRAQQFHFGATLISLADGADLELAQDTNANGAIEAGEIIATSNNPGAAQDRIAGTLRGGVYYLRVLGASTALQVPYLLRLSASPAADPGIGLSTAYNIGPLNTAATGIFGGTLVDADRRDYYRFTLAASTSVSLSLKSISGNADLQLIHDVNANGVLDAGEILATSAKTSGIDSIARTLGPGTYYIRVSRAGATATAYDLRIDA